MAKSRTAPKTFLGDQSGGIAIMFAASIVVMVGVVGLSIDGGRAMAAKQKTNAALDAAALAGTRAIMSGKSEADARDYAIEFYHNDLYSPSAYGADYGDPTVDIDMNTKTLRIAVTTKVPTTFGRVLGVKTIDFDSVSEATFNVRDIELGMALDVTGSMRGQKIQDLKDASKALIDTLIPDTGSLSDVKVAVAPYSASVNAGSALANSVTNFNSPDGCVFERSGSSATYDTAPGIGTWLSGTGTMRPVDIDPTERLVANAYTCPPARVIPLTNDKDLLKNTIDTYDADGYTAGHLGAAWGWYTISPEWSGIWPGGSTPRPYFTRNLVKAVVLMTDGVFNTAYLNGKSSTQAIDICQHMKDQGVLVYSVGFQAPSNALVTLTDCASNDPSSGRKLVYDARDGAALYAAFQDIAIKLTNLRLAQ